MKTGPSRSLLQPSNHSSGIKVPANERPHQLSATLHGFGGSPEPALSRVRCIGTLGATWWVLLVACCRSAWCWSGSCQPVPIDR